MTSRVRQSHQVVVLGSGTSTGLPVLGCPCPVCTHADPKNQRLRSSVWLKTATGQHLVVDAGPDLRTQLLRAGVSKVHGLILTHAHADHFHGIDDLRPLSFLSPVIGPSGTPHIPIYTDSATAAVARERFPYIFKRDPSRDTPSWRGGVAQLNLQELPGDILRGEEISYAIGGDDFEFFCNPHGADQTLAFVHGKLAYIVDCHEISPHRLDRLREKQLDLLIIDCVRIKPHRTHLHLERVLEYARVIAPKLCGLTHLGHDFEHNELSERLERDFSGTILPLYDGQVLSYGI